MKKPVYLFFLACGLSFFISGCGMDELKKEVENKNTAIKACEAEKVVLNKKIQELTVAQSKKDTDLKTSQAQGAKIWNDLGIANTELSAAKVQADLLTKELEEVKAELQACSAKKSKKK
jgi:predicted  nucleic acid-binding Zn-ribbon protein